ncbi:pentapeptide repeat-containing protein [Paenibacillus sp. MBLB4367]|uniref:pentapeptide repeat-containing protein n=1 Tax=Paenibacillus sp. MBLB4367 TaxID=3384767 RepID=UPI003907EB38
MNEKEVWIEIVDKREPKQKLVVKNSDISHSVFTDCRAEHVAFHDISLPHVKVTYADLSHCLFNDMNMRDGKISDANLSRLTIEGANISGLTIRNAGADNQPAAFENVEIPNSTFTGCDLTHVNLIDCKIEGLRINGVLIEELLNMRSK